MSNTTRGAATPAAPLLLGELTVNCPDCGEDCDRDEVDVGVGVIYGPWGCYSCGWSEYDRKRAEAENPGWYCDPTGGLHRISAIVENANRFGLGEAAAEAFKDCGKEEGKK